MSDTDTVVRVLNDMLAAVDVCVDDLFERLDDVETWDGDPVDVARSALMAGMEELYAQARNAGHPVSFERRRGKYVARVAPRPPRT